MANSHGRGRRAASGGRWPTLIWLAAFAYLVAFPPLLNPGDESLFLYGAKRILNGQALYHDVFEFITPAGFYFFALVFGVAGTTLRVARVAMGAVNALSCVLVYALARQVAGPAESVLAALAGAVACFPVWNMASPHWLSTALCLAAPALLLGADDVRRARAAAVGAVVGLAFCTEQQQGALLALWVVAALAMLAYRAEGRPRWRRELGEAIIWFAAAGAGVTLVILGYSVWRSSFRELLDGIFAFVLESYGKAFLGFMPWAGSLGPPVTRSYTWAWLPHVVPWVLALEMAVLLRALRHRGGRTERVRASLLLLAAAMLVSILYFPDYVHIAFVTPFALVVGARLAHEARTHLARHGRAARRAGAAVTAAAFLAVFAKGWSNLERARAEAPERYPTAFGTLAGTKENRELLEALRRTMPSTPGAVPMFFSYPVDPWLYLTIPGDNPTPFSILIPGYNTPEQFQTVVNALDRNPDAYVVVDRPTINPARDPLLRYLNSRYGVRANVGPERRYGVYARVGAGR